MPHSLQITMIAVFICYAMQPSRVGDSERPRSDVSQLIDHASSREHLDGTSLKHHVPPRWMHCTPMQGRSRHLVRCALGESQRRGSKAVVHGASLCARVTRCAPKVNHLKRFCTTYG